MTEGTDIIYMIRQPSSIYDTTHTFANPKFFRFKILYSLGKYVYTELDENIVQYNGEDCLIDSYEMFERDIHDFLRHIPHGRYWSWYAIEIIDPEERIWI